MLLGFILLSGGGENPLWMYAKAHLKWMAEKDAQLAQLRKDHEAAMARAEREMARTQREADEWKRLALANSSLAETALGLKVPRSVDGV